MGEILKNAEFATVIGGIMILSGILIILTCIIGAVMDDELEKMAGMLALLATFGALVIVSGLVNITIAKDMVTTEDKRVEALSTYKYYIDNKEINVSEYDLSEYTVDINEGTHTVNLVKKNNN